MHLILGLLAFQMQLSEAQTAVKPVTPDASPQAVELLDYLYDISGKNTLSGQHCAPLVGSTTLSVVHRGTGKYPALFGQDFGFSYPGYWDGINYRQRIIDEAIQRHDQGFIITLMWHAVVPTQDEPVTFDPFIRTENTPYRPTDEQWLELTTPGTNLNERWKSQVDVVAWFLKQLKNAGVPVLWRPYHEMNGRWFWWGARPGENGYQKLWRMLYNRLVNFHGLNNLVWVFNANEVKEGVGDYELFYPGADVVDILATDVYSEGFNQLNYDQLTALAGNKPVALGEVGRPPSLEILESQPKWTWFMRWGQGGYGPGAVNYRELLGSERVLTLDNLPWASVPEEPSIHYPVIR